MTLAMGRGHKHTWRPHPPGGRWRQSWDEVYWDEEEMANNRNTNSQDKLEDIKFFLSRDPNYRNSDDWPELVEWCSSCPDTRKVKFVMEDTKVNKEEKVVVKAEVVKAEEAKDTDDPSERHPSKVAGDLVAKLDLLEPIAQKCEAMEEKATIVRDAREKEKGAERQ